MEKNGFIRAEPSCASSFSALPLKVFTAAEISFITATFTLVLIVFNPFC
jgi:hypothetical protein